MTFSEITLKILERLKKLRANGDPDADRKLAQNIEAAIAGRPLPSDAEELSLTDLTDAEIRYLSEREPTRDEVKRRAYAKVIAGVPLDPDEENAMIGI